MEMRFRKLLSFFSLALILSLVAGCGPTNIAQVEAGMKARGREVAIGERFKLTRDEKVWIKDTPLTIELKGTRHTWYVDGKSETVDAEFIVTSSEKEQRRWIALGKKMTVDDYVIELLGADPFGKNDSELVVTRQ